MSKLLTEQSSSPTKVGNNWRAILITPGQGSSGIYTEDVLKEYGPTAFPKGSHSYIDHPSWMEDGRSAKNLMGVLTENAYYEDGVGLVAEIEVMPHWKEFVEAVAPHTGLSIYAMATGEYNSRGDFEIVTLEEDMQNSVDLVSYPGREGSKLADKLYAAAVSNFVGKEVSPEKEVLKKGKGTAARKAAVPKINKEEGYSDMDVKELADKFDALPALVADAVAEALKAAAAIQEEVEEVSAEAVAEAMVAANLPEVSRRAVYESLRAGGDLTEAIEAQVAYVDSVKLHLKEEAKASPVTAEEKLIVDAKEAKESLTGLFKIAKVGA